MIVYGCEYGANSPVKFDDITFVSQEMKECVYHHVVGEELTYANQLTKMFCQQDEVSSTEDLKHFPNLKRLTFYGLKTTQGINYDDLYNLEEISFTLTKIESFRFDKLPNLQEISIKRADNLHDLDLSKNEHLSKILLMEVYIHSLLFNDNAPLKDIAVYGLYSVIGGGWEYSTVSSLELNRFDQLERLNRPEFIGDQFV
jgi:hypothetical protein